MFNYIKNIIINWKRNKCADEIFREYDVISFLISECFIMEDFIFCKRKIKRFEQCWKNFDGFESLGDKLSKKLNDQYNKRLIKQKYYIGLYAEKKRKKKIQGTH